MIDKMVSLLVCPYIHLVGFVIPSKKQLYYGATHVALLLGTAVYTRNMQQRSYSAVCLGITTYCAGCDHDGLSVIIR